MSFVGPPVCLFLLEDVLASGSYCCFHAPAMRLPFRAINTWAEGETSIDVKSFSKLGCLI